jgi:hypothetical protein
MAISQIGTNAIENGSIVTADIASGAVALATQTSGVLPSASLPTGCVLQVVQQVYTAFTTTSSTSYVDTGLTLNITPKFSTSKILIQVGMELALNGLSNSISSQIVKNGSSLITQERCLLSSANTSANIFFQYLDSPATTSSLTYKIQWASLSGNLVRLNDWQTADNKAFSSITLMEIAG